jgi:preprotein translocase subunit SecE
VPNGSLKDEERIEVAVDPARFVREVRSEIAKVTWPSRRETLVSTGLVIAMAAAIAIFFLIVDQVIGLGVRALFGTGF